MMRDSVRTVLEDRMDPDSGLLDRLQSSEVLTYREIQEIKCLKPAHYRNCKLLTYIEKKRATDQLTMALIERNQEHMANFLMSNGEYADEFEEEWPLSAAEISRIDHNQCNLVDLLEPKELIFNLFAKGVINRKQKNVLTEKRESKQIELLIEIFRRTSRAKYRTIIECLETTGQSHIAEFLRVGGAIVTAHVDLHVEEMSVDEVETRIVQSFRELLKTKTLEEQQQILELVQLGGDDVHLIGVKPTGSICLYFHCTTFQGVMRLYDLLSSDRFRETVEAVFTRIMTESSNNFETLTATIRWQPQEYKRCKAYFIDEPSESNPDDVILDQGKGADSSKTALDEMTNCCICARTYENPKSLPCLHTFCLKCLEQYAENKSSGERISCPVCRQAWKIPVTGVRGFPRNPFVEKLVEIGGSTEAASAELCDICLEDGEDSDGVTKVALKHCIDCQQNMCIDCARQHAKHKPSKTHEVVSLADFKEADKNKLKSSTCEIHFRKPLAKYCVDCQMTICQICFEENHIGHTSKEVKEAAEEIQRELDAAAATVTRLVEEVRKELQENSKSLFLGRFDETELAISTRCDQVKTVIDLQKHRLLEYLRKIKRRIEKEYGMELDDIQSHHDQLQIFLNMVKDLKTQGSISDITGVGSSLLARVNQLQSNHHKINALLLKQNRWPLVEFIPLDLDELVTYNTGNVIGKIKVDCRDDGETDEYYSFWADDDSDDSYTDCVFDASPTAKSDEYASEADYPSAELEYSYASTFKTEGIVIRPVAKPRSKSHPGLLQIHDDFQIEEINKDRASRGSYADKSRDRTDSETYQKSLKTYDFEASTKPPIPPKLPEKIPPPPPRRSKTSPAPLSTSVTGELKSREINHSSISVEKRIRRGKFTEIWAGKFEKTQDVSVKTFTRQAMSEAWIIKSCDFFQEANVLSRIDHPNIVKLIGISSLRIPYYVLTETTELGYLDQYLKQDKGEKIKFIDIINMTSQVVLAMHYLEMNHCIHRYLSVESVLVGENNKVKLANFEMARFLDETRGKKAVYTDTYEILESPMKTRAPEVIESQRWSIQSDVWSFGIFLYQMLSYGAEPYPGLSDMELMNIIITTYEIPSPAGSEFHHSDAELLKTMQQCWTKDPFKRPEFKDLVTFFRGYFNKAESTDAIRYSYRPKLLNTIKAKGSVTGVTVLNDEVFITRTNTTDIVAYNITSYKQTRLISVFDKKSKFDPMGVLKNLKGKSTASRQKLNCLQDITCCQTMQCLYTCDWEERSVFRVHTDSKGAFLSWEVDAGEPSGLSVTTGSTLLVVCASEHIIFAYSSVGTRLNEIAFGWNSEHGLLHAVQLDTNHLVVVHGDIETKKLKEGVSIIDVRGQSSFETKSIELHGPSHLAIDSNNQILIAEKGRNSIILASSNLQSHRVLVGSERGIQAPTRIHLNETSGQLFVGQEDGSVLIYRIMSLILDKKPSYSQSRSLPRVPPASVRRGHPEPSQEWDEGLYESLPS